MKFSQFIPALPFEGQQVSQEFKPLHERHIYDVCWSYLKINSVASQIPSIHHLQQRIESFAQKSERRPHLFSLRFFSLNTSKKLRLRDYSVRKLFTGFLTALRIDWYPTVIMVSKIMATPAITNTFASMDIR
jgi:hypothetical protein